MRNKSYMYLSFLLFIIMVFTGCGGGGGRNGGGNGGDTTPPTISSVNPSYGATDIVILRLVLGIYSDAFWITLNKSCNDISIDLPQVFENLRLFHINF